jgi:hypothetical protein
MTDSPLGKYDRAETVVLTHTDGRQEFASRPKPRHGYSLAPLTWWRTLGIYKDEQEQWIKSVNSPEYAILLTRVGIKPADLRGVKIPEPQFAAVLEWFNVFRAFYPDYNNFTLEFLNQFLAKVRRVTKGNAARSPFRVGEYIKNVDGSNLPVAEFTFLIGHDSWIDACKEIDGPVSPLSDIIRTMMQFGLTPEIVPALTKPEGKQRPTMYAMTSSMSYLWKRDELVANPDSYRNVRLLADIETVSGNGSIRDLFMTEGTDRQRLRDLVVLDGMRELPQLEAICLNDTPRALAIGAL